MAIKIEMLRCFRAVVSHGSLVEAARALGRTPSAVSMMLKQFEAHIGAPLFETARKSRLTPLGELIDTEARRELDHFERTVAAIEGLSRAEMGHVRIAVTPSVATAILPAILRRFMEEHPKVRIDMRDMDSQSVLRELEKERADIGLATVGPTPGLERRTLFSDRFGLVCRADHPLAARGGAVGWADLEGESFIANRLCALIGEDGFAPILEGSRLMVPNTTSLLGLVKAGVGVTILPRLAVLPEYRDLALLPLGETAARRSVQLLTPPRQVLTPAARAFVAAITSAEIAPLLNEARRSP